MPPVVCRPVSAASASAIGLTSLVVGPAGESSTTVRARRTRTHTQVCCDDLQRRDGRCDVRGDTSQIVVIRGAKAVRTCSSVAQTWIKAGSSTVPEHAYSESTGSELGSIGKNRFSLATNWIALGTIGCTGSLPRDCCVVGSTRGRAGETRQCNEANSVHRLG